MSSSHFSTTFRFAYTLIILILLSSCVTRRQSTPQLAAPASQESALVSARSVDEAISAFEKAELVVDSYREESLNQDWFPGTIKASSFSACSSCTRSYIFLFDNQANYERAFEDYSLGGFYTYGNSNRVLLIVAKDINASTANRHGAAFGAKQSH